MGKLKTIVGISILNFFLIASLVIIVSSIKGQRSVVTAEVNTDLYNVTQAQADPLIAEQQLVPSITPALEATSIPVATNTPIPVKKPTAKPPSNRCIIVIQGVKYDVTDFRNIHSGGNIFKCGTDMTNIFFGQHNSSTLSAMAKYRI
jgi:cytochrome b involved in lipid metabolism